MITQQLLEVDGIAIVEPSGPLSQDDFAALTASVDAYLADHDALNGILIHTRQFPGWEDFAGLTHHIRFVKDHHRMIRRVALVSDSPLTTVAPRLAKHFISADVQSFAYDDYETALAWLRAEP